MCQISNEDIQNLQVSSVFKNDKNFGKQNIFDGNEETCWRSDEGTPQWISFEFKQPHSVSCFSIQFQGGFVGQNCHVEFTNNEQLTTMPFYPEDENGWQAFVLATSVICKQVKFNFLGSSDFYGRIIVYSIKFSFD